MNKKKLIWLLIFSLIWNISLIFTIYKNHWIFKNNTWDIQKQILYNNHWYTISSWNLIISNWNFNKNEITHRYDWFEKKRLIIKNIDSSYDLSLLKDIIESMKFSDIQLHLSDYSALDLVLSETLTKKVPIHKLHITIDNLAFQKNKLMGMLNELKLLSEYNLITYGQGFNNLNIYVDGYQVSEKEINILKDIKTDSFDLKLWNFRKYWEDYYLKFLSSSQAQRIWTFDQPYKDNNEILYSER